jgi:hypothetical protein
MSHLAVNFLHQAGPPLRETAPEEVEPQECHAQQLADL